MPGPPEHSTTVLGGFRTAVRRTTGEGDPVVFVHGNPSFSFDWEPLMQELRRPAIAFDLPNFGNSERVDPAIFDASQPAYAAWVGQALDELGLDRFGVVVHDWGGLALEPAAARADRVDRVVVVNAVPLFSGYRWHWVARVWRRPGMGEQLMAGANKAVFTNLLRLARPGLRAMPADWVEQTWRAFDAETRAAVLALYRSADSEVLGEAGAGLGRLTCPARVFWGDRDPYLGTRWGRAYAGALPGAKLVEIPAAGHWPWIDKPGLAGAIARFLDSGD